MKEPNIFFQELTCCGGYKLTNCLGGYFCRDPNGTHTSNTSSSTEVKSFGGLPKKWMSPNDKDDHLELDPSEDLPAVEGI
jgi:hypothetical protein